MDKKTAFAYEHAPLPLPFNPAKLQGLSERLMVSHWENNYGGAVKALNTVRSRLVQALNDANTPPYVYNGLKREQLMRTNIQVPNRLMGISANNGNNKASKERDRHPVVVAPAQGWPEYPPQ
jgi:Fe-Mn family superoxide dismutase